jgi:hypothetical protein
MVRQENAAVLERGLAALIPDLRQCAVIAQVRIERRLGEKREKNSLRRRVASGSEVLER